MIIMKNKTTIRFYSGLDSIGGVIMEVSYNKYRAFFEAGRAYNPDFNVFDGSVNIRNCFIQDYIWTNQIPMIDGIYRKQDIEKRFPNIISAEDFDIDDQAFFISHLHLDHMAMMGMISADVKVYHSKPAQIIEKALEDVHQGVETIRKDKYEDMPDETNIGDIYVKRFVLNDDSYQDYSFYIETPDLKIHYTGDIFLYGKYEDNILKEIEYLNKKDVDILVCEGTRFFKVLNPEDYIANKMTPSFKPKDNLITKKQLDDSILNTVSNHKGLVVFNYYEREMSDVMLFEMIASKTNRTIIYEPESAHIINAFFNKKVNIMIPDTYKNIPDYLKEIIDTNTLITKDEILNNPDKYLVENTYPNILELLDYRNIDAIYLHHSGSPLGEFDPKYKNMLNIVEKANMKYVETYQTEQGYFSPHAEHYQILAYIEMLKSKLVIPCHTLNREAMIKNITKKTFYANKDKKYIYNRELNTLETIDE